MNTPTCSTRRLHTLLLTLRGLNVPADANNRLFDILPKVMKIEGEDANRRAIQALAMLEGMFSSVTNEIDACWSDLRNRTHHKRPLAGLASAFGPLSLGSFWAQHKAALRAEDVTGLDYTSLAIENIRPENRIDQTDLDSLLGLVEAAKELLRDSSLENEVVILLVRALDSIRSAVFAYDLIGVEGLKESLFYYASAMAFYNNQVTEKIEPDALQKLWGVIAKVSDVIAIAQVSWVGYHALLPSANAMLHLTSGQ